jgi:tRNA dimethylallyltransferase
MNYPTLIVLTGPTASGKTAVAIDLAKYYKTVIVSADSRQFYREMSIGTAKPDDQELNTVPHYFVNSHSITETFPAGKYEMQCIDLLNDLFRTHNIVILAGGSGLFIKAVCEGFDDLPAVTPGTREKLNHQFSREGIAVLQDRLKAVDPSYFEQADINNPQRVIRALEVFESTGKPFSAYRKSTVNTRPFKIVKFGLQLPRKVLYERINRRVDDMIKRGLADEVESLLPYRNLNALNTVGYTELFDYFDGKTDLDTAIALIKQNTRRFAKRQMTWFGKDEKITWINGEHAGLANDIISKID